MLVYYDSPVATAEHSWNLWGQGWGEGLEVSPSLTIANLPCLRVHCHFWPDKSLIKVQDPQVGWVD